MFKNLPYKGCIYFSFALNIIVVIVYFLLKNLLPPVVPLFYGLPGGAEQLVPSLEILIAPTIGIFITIVNITVSNITNDIFVKRMLIVSSAATSLLLTFTVIKIILLVGFF